MTALDETLPPGTTLGRYRIVRTVGSGGMGTVYEAVHTDLDKRVALKVLHAAITADPVARARFLREGQAAARIRHPHVVELFDVGQDDGRLFLVLEYLEGQSLSEFLGARGRLPVAELVDLVLPLCAALACVHEAGVVHRDLKPDNVFLARTRHGVLRPMLLDFGISKVASGGRALTREEFLGTPEYMSPEQVHDTSNVDARTDQYALGVLLYEGVTGRRPFENGDLYELFEAILFGKAPPPRALVPELPEAFETVLLRCLARDRDQRFGSIRALGQALLPFAGSVQRSTWAPVFDRPDTPLAALVPPNPNTFAPPDAPTVALPKAPAKVPPRPRPDAPTMALPLVRRARRVPPWLTVAASLALVALLVAAVAWQPGASTPAARTPQVAAPSADPGATQVNAPPEAAPALGPEAPAALTSPRATPGPPRRAAPPRALAARPRALSGAQGGPAAAPSVRPPAAGDLGRNRAPIIE
ncbi:MAG: protein kinase [Deltaproteobacteria bacterium]|nr:protein kinase [Deltaproteobacteria bacterium]